MEKATVNMINWQLYVYDGVYNLSGQADNHPKLGKNTYVSYTSRLRNYDLTDDVLTYETNNTIYVCPLKYMCVKPYVNVVTAYKKELMHIAEGTHNCLDEIIAASAYIALEKTKECELARYITELQIDGQKEVEEMIEAEKERMCAQVINYEDSVYIEVSNISGGDLLAYHLGDYVGVVWPDVHVGMFQDSVLYEKYGFEEEDECTLDFRYFPLSGEAMETYSWSDNIRSVVIKNINKYAITFNKEKIEPGEIKVFTQE